LVADADAFVLVVAAEDDEAVAFELDDAVCAGGVDVAAGACAWKPSVAANPRGAGR
jgi:hypothetical protein